MNNAMSEGIYLFSLNNGKQINQVQLCYLLDGAVWKYICKIFNAPPIKYEGGYALSLETK